MNYHQGNNLKNQHLVRNVLLDLKESKVFQASLDLQVPLEKEVHLEGLVSLGNPDKLELWACLEKLADLEWLVHLDFVDLLVLKD